MKKSFKYLTTVIFSLILVSNISLASNITIETTGEFNKNEIQNEIVKDGITYVYEDYTEKEFIPQTVEKEIIGNEKDVSDISLENLKKEFEKIYNYEDETYKGELQLEDFKITTVDNGYMKKIDSQYIEFNNLSTNDLEQIPKEKYINGIKYILINVNWKVNETVNINKTVVPISYNGQALYQAIKDIKNSDTYIVKPIYRGSVLEKQKNNSYILNYKEKENYETEKEDRKNIVPILSVGGMIFVGIVYISFHKNATIYNIQKGKMIKLKSVKIKANSILDITNCEQINGNNFLLKIKESSYTKLKGKKVYIKFNNQKKPVFIVSRNNSFKF